MRTLLNWNPFRELDLLHRELDRIFENNFPSWRNPSSRASFLPDIASHSFPLLNMAENENELRIEAMAPGIDPETLKVTAVNNQLTISGEKQALCKNSRQKPETYHRNERAAGRFIRSLSLPAEVDTNNVEANYKNGMLNITLHKAEAAKPRQIAVKIS